LAEAECKESEPEDQDDIENGKVVLVADTVNAIITALWTILTGDATLKTLCGGTVRCYFPMATSSPDFPYLNHDLDPGIVPAQWSIVDADYSLDIWEYSPKAASTLAIRDQIITLLDQRAITTASGEIIGGRLALVNGGFIDTDQEHVRHYAMAWQLRYARKAEITNIVGR